MRESEVGAPTDGIAMLFSSVSPVNCISQSPLLHRLLPQTKVLQGHQGKAVTVLPARAVVCQSHPWNRHGDGRMTLGLSILPDPPFPVP